jgi:hypothetical protein
MRPRIKEVLGRRRVIGRLKFTLESILAVAGTIALVVTIWHHFDSKSTPTYPGEGKRVVAFRQVSNRICTEHRQNLHRALAEPGSRVEHLGFIARAVGWDVHDLESVTAPPTRFDAFVAEVAVRRRVGPEVLALQGAIESGDQTGQARAIAELETLETESRELSRESGVVRCMRMLPPIQDLLRK